MPIPVGKMPHICRRKSSHIHWTAVKWVRICSSLIACQKWDPLEDLILQGELWTLASVKCSAQTVQAIQKAIPCHSGADGHAPSSTKLSDVKLVKFYFVADVGRTFTIRWHTDVTCCMPQYKWWRYWALWDLEGMIRRDNILCILHQINDDNDRQVVRIN